MHAPTRRTVLTASAWAVPAVSVAAAAPAFAVSPGSAEFVVNGMPLALRTETAATQGVFTHQPVGAAQPITLTMTRAAAGSYVAYDPRYVTFGNADGNGSWDNTYSVVADNGLAMTNGVLLQQRTLDARIAWPHMSHQFRVDHTLSFSRPVTNLSFTVVGIRQHDDVSEAVEVAPAPSAAVLGPVVTRFDDTTWGSGLGYWVGNTTSAARLPTTVRLTFPGPVSQVVLSHMNASMISNQQSRNQAITLGDFSFTTTLREA